MYEFTCLPNLNCGYGLLSLFIAFAPVIGSRQGLYRNVISITPSQWYLPVESVCSRIKNLGLCVQRAGLNSEMCDLRQLT